MQYQSTRNKAIAVSAAEAIKKGLSEDGGLFVPESLPSVTMEEIGEREGISHQNVSKSIGAAMKKIRKSFP